METQGFISRSSDLPKCRCLPPSLLRDTLSSRVCRQGSTALELDGTRNTNIQTGSGRELRNTLRPVWLFVLPQVLMMFRGGPCPPLYIRGDKITWKVLAEYSWSPTTTQQGSFLCTAASSTPIQVVTRGVRYIHELSLILEHSMSISSPAVPGLTISLCESA